LKRVAALIILTLTWLFTAAQVQETKPSSFKLFFEKAYLHTDRELYAPGEDLWFKAYLVDARTNKLTNSSNTLYAELIDPEAKIVQRKVIRLDGGLGNGDFHLGDSLASGTWKLRAYTSWMRNFGDNFFFEKEITLTGREATGTTSATKSPDARDISRPADARVNLSASASPVPSLRFFPEGGSLIDGVPGIVALKAEDPNGKGIPASGTIFSSSGEPLTAFTCDSTGTGSVFLDIASGESYTARAAFAAGSPRDFPLPRPLLTGFSLFVKQTDSIARMIISTNPQTLSAHRGDTMTVVARNKGKVVFFGQFVLSALQQSFSVPLTGLPNGITALTIYDSQHKPHCERLIYIPETNPASLSVAADKAAYAPGEKVTLRIRAADAGGKPLSAALSLSAVDASVIPVSGQHIGAYLDLVSELKGPVADAGRYFDPDNPLRNQQLDLLLLTRGWRDFVWKRLADSALRISYPLEQGITVSGTVVQGRKKEPAKDATVTLLASQARGSRIFSAKTDSAGRYYFDDVRLFGEQLNLRISSKDAKGGNDVILSMDSLYALPPGIRPVRIEAAQQEQEKGDTIVQARLAERSRAARKPSLSDTLRLKEVTITGQKSIRLVGEFVMTLGYPDEVYRIRPEDYSYSDLYHYLQTVSKARVGDFVFNTTPGPPAENGAWRLLRNGESWKDSTIVIKKLLYYPVHDFPRIFVNGRQMPYDGSDKDLEMMCTYQETYFSLPMNKVKSVTIRRTVDQQAKDVYLVYLTLVEGAMDPPMTHLLSAAVNGYSDARVFYSPVRTQVSSKPDLRTTIHWEPNITTNEKGEATLTFYNADPKTRIRIVAEGVTAGGQPVSATVNYEVK
jgi:hypothetical protein